MKKMAKDLADYYDLADPPQVKMIRAIPPEELDSKMLECKAEEGFTPDAEGTFDIPPAQEYAYKLAEYTCSMQYPPLERYSKQWSSEQKSRQYDWTVKFLIPCLEDRGHQITDVPSRGVFIDQWNSEPFYPLEQAAQSLTGDAADWNRSMTDLEQACPQIAPSSILWDGESVDDWSEANRDSAGR